jgi:hypothetical protein
VSWLADAAKDCSAALPFHLLPVAFIELLGLGEGRCGCSGKWLVPKEISKLVITDTAHKCALMLSAHAPLRGVRWNVHSCIIQAKAGI